MELQDILAITGQPGLFKFVAQSSNGIIVESLSDGKRSNASASSKVSSMAEIAIFTQSEDVPLAKVFENIFTYTSGQKAISHKASGQELKDFFNEVLPDWDQERVHVSDIKKVVAWFNILVDNGFTEFKVDSDQEQEQE